MRALGCKDMGMDCPFVATGETDDEVIQKSMNHAMAEHKANVDKMMQTMSKEQMMADMKSKVHDA